MIPGEAHRDRVIGVAQEKAYLAGAQAIGTAALEAYQRALVGIRASDRGEVPIKPRDPFLLHEVATILSDCGIRPDECFRLRWENHQNDVIEITCTLAKVEHFPLYTFRHTCLTRWAPFMDPWTLAYLAGHRDMSITKRYVHPQEFSTRAAMEKARVALGGHSPILNTEVRISNLPASS